MRRNVGRLLLGTLALLAPAGVANAQCDVLVRETFRLGDRPHGNGRLRAAGVYDVIRNYWPQVGPINAKWLTPDGTASDGRTALGWTFAASSIDPAEVDPLDQYNGTAFGVPGAVAILPFVAPASPFTLSAEVVMGLGSGTTIALGYTSSSVLVSNIQTNGSLWVTLNGRGEWAIHANGSEVVASGATDVVGTFNSGWLHVDLSYDPVASSVSGRIMDTPVGPYAVTLTKPLSWVCMESMWEWNVVNNLSVWKGSPLSASVGGTDVFCPGDTVTLHLTSNAPADAAYSWSRASGLFLHDGPQDDGSVVSGSATDTLVITNARESAQGEYFGSVATACGLSAPASHAVALGACANCPADFNQDGGVDGADVAAFFAAWESGHASADVNADGGVDGSDVSEFLILWEAGGC